MSGEIAAVWDRFLCYLEKLNSVRVKRFVFVQESVIQTVINNFADSSKHVYCVVAYLYVVTSVGVKVSFLASKNKVAPLKELSIARLELLGCVLLSKRLKDIRLAIDKRISVDKMVCLTDSEVVFCWIKGKKNCWKPWK